MDSEDEENKIGDDSRVVHEDLALFINQENNVTIVKKLVEENNQLKDLVSRMKESAFKTENDINQLLTEYESFENFKKYILAHFKTIGENTKDVKVQLDKLTEKYNKLQFTC